MKNYRLYLTWKRNNKKKEVRGNENRTVYPSLSKVTLGFLLFYMNMLELFFIMYSSYFNCCQRKQNKFKSHLYVIAQYNKTRHLNFIADDIK